MKRLAVLALVGWLFGTLPVGAEGPDDQFIRVYNLIQQADSLRANGQTDEARQRYLEAQGALDKLAADYPGWNTNIISYRRRYIAERMGPLPTTAVPAAAPSATTPAVATPGTTPAPELQASQLAALNEEVGRLRADNQTLQAKLREALSAQPAAVDPRELAQAQERLRTLEKDNALLKVTTQQQQEKLASGPDLTALAEAHKRLEAADRVLTRQSKELASLTEAKAALEARLKQASPATPAPARGAEPPAPSAAGATAAGGQVTELQTQLRKAQSDLTNAQAENGVLKSEKATLERRVAELSKPSASATGTTVAQEPVKPARKTRAARAAEKAQLQEVERERDELRKRVFLLTRQLENRKLGRGSAQGDALTEELAIARARLEVYEATPVPYSPEELALLHQTPVVGDQTESNLLSKHPRRLPPEAAALVAEAKSAFGAQRFAEAEQKYQAALKLDEKNLGMLTDLAATQVEAGHLNAAEVTVQRALNVDPNYEPALSVLGLVRIKQHRIDQALNTLSRAAQLDPDDAQTQNYLGSVLLDKGQLRPAEAALRRAVRLVPGYGEAHVNLAVLYTLQKPPFLELARWHYQKALEAGCPRNPHLDSVFKAKDHTAAQ